MDKRGRIRTIERREVLRPAAVTTEGNLRWRLAVVAMTSSPNLTLPRAAEGVEVSDEVRFDLAPVSAAVTGEAPARRRTWLSRVMLVHSDAFALLFAYFAAEQLFGSSPVGLSPAGGLFVLTIPIWLLVIREARLYSRD